MIGILTEKPSAMRNFAKALGGSTGSFNGEEFCLVHARGHLYEFKSPDQMVIDVSKAAQYKSWDIRNLPWNENDLSWERSRKSGSDINTLLKKIKKEFSACDEICIATDDDPTGEGELLAWEILDELKLKPKKYTRMYFEDESVKSIQKAFKERKTLPKMQEDMDYVKALYRSQWDYLSIQWTRIATCCGDGRRVIRQGRLKSAMVRLVGDQAKAVADYKKVPYFQNRFKDTNDNVFVNDEEKKYDKKEEVPDSYSHSSVVVEDTIRKHTAPPKLLDLAALSSLLSSKGVKAESVLSQYQKMYEQQIVSYPRTEDKTITPEQFSDLVPKVDQIADLIGVDKSKLTHRQARSTHVKTGGAHGANRPGIHVPGSLADLDVFGPNARDIYTLLAKNFLAMFAEDYEYDSITAHVVDYPDFKCTIEVPKKVGWKDVFNPAPDEQPENQNTKGFGEKAYPFVYTGYPKKPTAPTMKWLMKQLEKYDVGTGATRTTIYADVTNARARDPLLQEHKGKLSMAPAGEISYALLADTHIGNIHMTESLQKEMAQIAKGQKDPASGLAAVAKLVTEDLEVMQKNGLAYREEKEIKMEEKKQQERISGMWRGQPVAIKKEWGGHTFTEDEANALFEGNTIEVKGLTAASGKKYDAKLRLEEQTYNGRKFIGPKLQSNGLPKSWCDHTFTEEERKSLEAGEKIFLEDCVSKKGNAFSCSVTYKNGKIVPDFDS